MAERRFSATASLRIERAEGDTPGGPRIVGHAAVYDQWTTLYESKHWVWREVIRPGAFTRAVKKKQDVRSLFNHDANFVLGRTKSGTLTISEDDRGLLTDTTPPDTQTIRDLVLAPIERGDVSGMSFAFVIRAGKKAKLTEKDGMRILEDGGQRITERFEGETMIEEREILDLDLLDISPVTYPAYDGTDVAMRSVLDIEKRIAERDRPHRRPAPEREALRAWLDSLASAGGAGR
jgi:uncharacterized protein